MKRSSRMKKMIFWGICLLSCPGFAQKLKRADRDIATELSVYGQNLRPDSGLQGQAPPACTYMSTELAKAGLVGNADAGGFVQVVHIDEGKVMGSRCALSLDGKAAVPGTDFFPLVGCPDAHTGGSAGISLNERGLPWIYDLRYDLEGGKGDPAFDIHKILIAKAIEAKAKGATALLLYNSSSLPDGFRFDGGDKKSSYVLPVVYINKKLSAKVFKDPTAYVDIDLTVATQERAYDLYNVEAYVDNGAERTVVLEAAYDTTPGAAALLTLARLVKRAGWKKHNYLVLAYNGGQQVQTLNDYFARHPGLHRDNVDYVVDVEGLASPAPGLPELKVKACNGREDWKEMFTGKKETYLQVLYQEAPGDTLGIPGRLAFSTGKPGAPGYEGEALAVRYIFNSLASVEKK
jgi:hypothetical protein